MIDAEQVERILAYEASVPPAPRPQDSSITATEVITYAGALVTLAGLATLLGTQYRQLGTIGRLAIPGFVVAAALVVAWILPAGRARARRAQTSLVTLAVVAFAYFVGQAQVELLGGPSASINQDTGYRVALVTALLSAILAGGFLAWLRSGLLAAAFGLALGFVGLFFSLWAHVPRGWPVELVFIVLAIVLIASTEFGRRRSVRWATEVLALIGGLLPIITAFISAGDGNLPLEIFAGLLAAAAFAAAVLRSSAGYAFAGGLGLFGFVLDIEFRYFRSSLGFAVSLVIAGLALLGIALLLARIVPNLRRTS